MERIAKIRKISYLGTGTGSEGPDTTYVVDMFEDTNLVETRTLLHKSKHYAEDVAENWENGIIKLDP